MKTKTGYIHLYEFFSIIVVFSTFTNAITWTQVSQKHKGCVNRLNRCERIFGTVNSDVIQLETLVSLTDENKDDSFEELLGQVQTKQDNLKNRIDRLQIMSEKITHDISVGSGNSSSCSDCVVSSVELLCRHIERVLSELTEITAQVREYENTIKQNRSATLLINKNRNRINLLKQNIHSGESTPKELTKIVNTQENAENSLKNDDKQQAMEISLEVAKMLRSFENSLSMTKGSSNVKHQIDTALLLYKKSQNKTAKSVIDKGIEYYNRADSLLTEKKHEEANKELLIARKLLEQAIEIMSGK